MNNDFAIKLKLKALFIKSNDVVKIQNRKLIILTVLLVINLSTITVSGSSNNKPESNYLTKTETKK